MDLDWHIAGRRLTLLVAAPEQRNDACDQQHDRAGDNDHKHDGYVTNLAPA